MQPDADISTNNSAIIKATQIWDIPGGIHPPENKEQSLQLPIGDAPLPTEIILPLNMHSGAPAEPVVNIGDRVLTGQMVAKPQGFVSAAIHASISGTVIAIEDRPLPHSSGMSGLSIVIQSDSKDEWTRLSPIEDYRSVEPKELVEHLQNYGLAGMGGAGFPTSVKLKPAKPINTLILNGTECEPYITSDHSLMRERAEDVIQGALLLAYILNEPEQILIGIENNKPDAVAKIKEAVEKTGDSRIQVIDFPTKYPSGGEKQLIQILTGKEVKPGKLPSDLGIVLQNVGTVAAALEAVTLGKPLISRVTTTVGHALDKQRNLNVRIGTPIQELLDYSGFKEEKAERIVMGGPMMGFSILNTQAPVTKITNCLLAPEKTELPELPPAQACIRCGHCAEACPASLLPQQLFWYAQAEDEEKLKDYNLFDCIECGACAYVCPSNIPLVQYYRAAKGDIREAEREKVKSDHARIRFEARQERLEKEAAERDAKRKARMEAAKAKQRNKENAEKDGSADNSAADLIAQAMARVNEAKAKPEDAQAKLDRQKQTFVDRITGLKGKIESSETDDQKARFEAQLKNTEKKLQSVLDKLTELKTETKARPESEQKESVEPANMDAASAAIARAKQKSEAMATMSDTEKLQNTLDSLRKRKEKSEQKLAEAEDAGAETIEALHNGLNKINEKILVTEEALKNINTGDEGDKDSV